MGNDGETYDWTMKMENTDKIFNQAMKRVDDKIAARLAKIEAEKTQVAAAKAKVEAEKKAAEAPRQVLLDVVNHIPSSIKGVLVDGTEESTVVQGNDEGKMFYIVAKAKIPIPEFIGEFGLPDPKALMKEISRYSEMKINRDEEAVKAFDFGHGTVVKTVSPRFIGDGKKIKIGDIAWDVVMPLDWNEVDRISKFLRASNDKMFHFIVNGTSLLLKIALSHHVDMKLRLMTTEELKALFKEAKEKDESPHELVAEQIASIFPMTVHLADDVDEKVLGENLYQYIAKDFLSVIRNINGRTTCVVKVCNRGVVGITLETERVIYDYYLKRIL